MPVWHQTPYYNTRTPIHTPPNTNTTVFQSFLQPIVSIAPLVVVLVAVLAAPVALDAAPPVTETTLPEPDGLAKDVLKLAADPVVAEAIVVELSGPVRKKFPARGGPRLSVSLKMVRLKLLRGVSGVMSIGASVSKLEGCSKRSTTYLCSLVRQFLPLGYTRFKAYRWGSEPAGGVGLTKGVTAVLVFVSADSLIVLPVLASMKSPANICLNCEMEVFCGVGASGSTTTMTNVELDNEVSFVVKKN